MSFSEVWSSLSRLRAAPGCGSKLSFNVLYSRRKQALLVPQDKKRAHQAVRFFIQRPLLKYWAHAMIELNHYLPALSLLPKADFEEFPLRAVFGINDLQRSEEQAEIAMFLGSPGPLQKIVIHCQCMHSGMNKIAKIAMTGRANAAIRRESHWLATLGQSAEIAAYLPALLQQSMLPCLQHYVTMTALPKGHSPKTFGAAHADFLRTLAKQGVVFTPWRDSDAQLRLKRRIDRLCLTVDGQMQRLWQQVLMEIEDTVGRALLPNLIVHGDFAPWNMRQVEHRLFVFDWEYAEAHGNPLQDFLHFHLIQRALRRREVTFSEMTALVHAAMEYADSQYGVDVGVAKACGTLTLHYLLDTISFYVETSGYLDETHPVLQCYLELLAQRAQWLPENVKVSAAVPQNLRRFEAEAIEADAFKTEVFKAEAEVS